MKKLLCEMLIIVSLVSVFGFWMLGEWRQRHPKPIGTITILNNTNLTTTTGTITTLNNTNNGYISEFCIPKNAKYKTNFTNPTSMSYLEVIK